MTATRSPFRRTFSAWIVLSAVAFNLAAGLVLPSSALAALADKNISIGASTDGGISISVVICTPNGLRVIRLGPDGVPLPDQPQRDANCIFCLPFNAGQIGALGVLPAEFVTLTVSERADYPVLSRTFSSDSAFASRPIRAPPTFQ